MVKNLPAMQEMWIQFLCGEDPPEKGMATHSSILAWRVPWTEEHGGLQFMGSQSQTQWSNLACTCTQELIKWFQKAHGLSWESSG